MPKKTFDPCKANACKIQACLKGKWRYFLKYFLHIFFNKTIFNIILENHYQEDKCLEVLEEMRQCCIKWKSVSLCCEGIDISKTIKQEDDPEKKV